MGQTPQVIIFACIDFYPIAEESSLVNVLSRGHLELGTPRATEAIIFSHPIQPSSYYSPFLPALDWPPPPSDLLGNPIH